MRPAAHYLRQWDYVTAQRPDSVLANSEHTRRRIAKYWRREASVIYPPVDIARFRQASATVTPGNYFLCAGQLMPYKRVDLAVEAFAKLGLPLVVAGDGPAASSLRRRATANVQFVGYKPDQQLAELVAGCRALVFPGEEDFGIVPVEAMAAGRPCIAFNRGGAIEAIEDGRTGILFGEQQSAALCDAIAHFLAVEKQFDSVAISASVERFSAERFVREFRSSVLTMLGSS
jgi:glycosyltransferase involved in cell wall biosynthesis